MPADVDKVEQGLRQLSMLAKIDVVTSTAFQDRASIGFLRMRGMLLGVGSSRRKVPSAHDDKPFVNTTFSFKGHQ